MGYGGKAGGGKSGGGKAVARLVAVAAKAVARLVAVAARAVAALVAARVAAASNPSAGVSRIAQFSDALHTPVHPFARGTAGVGD
jgi:hypothetical protein